MNTIFDYNPGPIDRLIGMGVLIFILMVVALWGVAILRLFSWIKDWFVTPPKERKEKNKVVGTFVTEVFVFSLLALLVYAVASFIFKL
jgi:hypothetical protein